MTSSFIKDHSIAIASSFMTNCTVRTYSDNGPYFPPTVMQYQANCLRDVLFHARLAMEDSEHTVAVFHDNRCTGLWRNEPDSEPDSDGEWHKGPDCYVFYRPGGPNAGLFNGIARQLA
jgi:hypothetical protein